MVLFFVRRVFVAMVICELWLGTKAEVFTAVTDCEPLLDTYKHVIDHLEDVIRKNEKDLSALKQRVNNYKKEHEVALSDIPNYLGNPINSFTLIKRLTSDLTSLEKSINMTNEYIRNKILSNESMIYPSPEDLSGAATALVRLQATYKLNVSELAEGRINGIAYGSPMSAGDCFELGGVLFSGSDYKNSVLWLLEALRKYDEEETDAYLYSKLDVMEFISVAYSLQNDFENALKWTRQLLELDPNHERALNNLQNFEKKMAEVQDKDEEEVPQSSIEITKYEALCRGEYEIAPEIGKKLTCFYLTKNHPFLRLAPIKTEQLYLEPEVFLFYDVISDREIEHVKSVAKPMFRRATVFNPVTGELEFATYRISKSAFLPEDAVIAPITRRITDFTGLSMDTAELLQVVNYGIGGHYTPHFDQALKDDNGLNKSKDGNRIATVLFYMSDVAQGGATAFTELGISVFPVKNSALFWMNLHPSGEGDLSTRHAGCPVLRGSKWVSNKWIRAVGQEFRRPCTLEYQPEEMVRKLTPSVHKTGK